LYLGEIFNLIGQTPQTEFRSSVGGVGGYLLHFLTELEATQNPQMEVMDTVEKMRNMMEKLSESCSLCIFSITPI